MSQRYEIREEIGKGGLGAVYKAFDTQLHREVAMKRVLTTEHASQEEVQAAADKLIAEAKTLSSLNHPNIVTVFDVGQDEKGGFVVMELLKGETLDETVSRGVLTQDDFIEIVYQTMEALIAAQASDVLHRDLKPTNVMVIWQPSGKFQTKILDFGLAKFSKSPSVQTMDQEDAVMGSIYFMAPEQFERSELDPRTDLYQIGCVYYHALTGQYPFRGETAPQVMNAHLQHRVTPLEKLRPDMSPSICQWVMWLINREMENRPADARDALDRFPRNPEPPNAEPVLQAIPVEDTPASATTGVQVVIPTQGAAPPKLRTGSAPIHRTGSAPVARVHTGSTPIRGARGRVTGPIQPPQPKSKAPLFITLGVFGLLIAGVIGWLVMKNANAAAERDRLGKLAALESPTGTADDIAIAVKYLESKDAAADTKGHAAEVLSRLEGDGVDEAIVSTLSTSPSSYVRLKLAQAAAEHGLTEAVVPMMAAFRAAGSDNQKSEILSAVRRVATQENLPALLDALEGSHSLQVRTIFEDIIIAVYRRKPLDSAAIRDLLARLVNTSGEERRSLFRILGALGTEDVATRLRTIFHNDSEQSLRYDAMTAFLNWPDRSALPLVEEILTTSDDNALKIAAGRAYARISGLPAAIPIAEKVEAWKKGLGYIGRAQDLRRVFAAMAETPAPEVKAVLEGEFRDPGQASLAKQALAQLEKTSKEAAEVAPGETLGADKVTITGDDTQGAFISPEAGAISVWRSPDTWFLWYFTVKEAGNYGFTVMQSFPREGTSEFEVIVGDQAFPGTAKKTPTAKDFEPVALQGSVALEPGRIYTLALHARGVTQPNMMAIQGIKVEKR
ncbi:MAG: protein kinase [Verrucomicrobiae bacterium]|nr:protein kinase [Verrucomicrobiae bacterium]